MANREQELFHDALARPDGQRAAFLVAACGGDAGLQARVEALLRAATEAGAFLSTAEMFERPGDRIGAYRLVARLGSGGFGVVYQAEQEAPVRRTVALKILKLGMDTRAVVARFEAERQALALMDHPHIARVFDGGSTEAGRPYFVMELVRGTPLTTFGREQRLSVAERLELFLQICRAVHHAHQKGIIHRDLKPSNLLVTQEDGRLVTKVIDFGIAKATRGPLTEGTRFTRLQLFVGTPDYMSPEQIGSGERDVDTRADIYSLGALLYEWLTDATPFDTRALAERGFAAVERAIREEEPVAPSRRVSMLPPAEASRVAAARQTTPKRLQAALRGDLDRIVLKCLEKDRERRYETTNALARDVQRYLRNEPILARPPTWTYLAAKFAQRHTRSVLTGMAAVLFLALLVVYHARQLARERDHAKLEAEKARKISALLTEALSAPDPFRSSETGVAPAPSVLLETVARARKEFANEPGLRAEVLNAAGRVYLRLGRHLEARPLLLEALEANRAAGAANSNLAQSLNDLGVLRREAGDYEGAVESLQQALAIRRQQSGAPPNETAVTLVELARVLAGLEQYDRAEACLREALTIRRQSLGEHRETAVSVGDLGFLLWLKGDLKAAEPLLEEGLAMQRRTVGLGHPNLAGTLSSLALLRKDQGRLEVAEQLLRHAHGIYERSLGAPHWRTARTLGYLAGVLRAQGRIDEAVPASEQALHAGELSLPRHSPIVMMLMTERARVALAVGDARTAEPLLREVLGAQIKLCPEQGWQVASTRSLLGTALLRLGRTDEAAALLTAASRVLREVPGPQGWETASTRAGLDEIARLAPRAP